ncbi:hypothetical protein [Nocardia sp. CA-119907]|uniref:hypothetical protein n=1 Tax=Nocardia sp. CA-119907 TaxID=3239973 RepID=UPI003D98F0FE
MPDEYDDIRRGLSRYERGLYFELGRAREQGETPERGWVRQFEINIGRDTRRLDSARTDGRGTRGVERKSGRVNEREAREQLRVERAGLESGQLTHSRWETVEGEKLPDKVREDMQALARDFPGQFHHQVISRADALRAMQLGRSLMSKQLELIRAHELVRADRARKRLENIREIVRTRKAREEKAREERARVEREAAVRVAREFAPPEQARTREDNREKGQPPPVPQRTPEQERENARTLAKQERDNARALAIENGLSHQMMGILGLNSNTTPPMIDAEQARARAEADRNRSIHQQRERERAQAREQSRIRGD